MSAGLLGNYTRVDLLWIEKKIEHWIRFGRAIEDQLLDRRRCRMAFAPESVSAFVRRASNDVGTAVSRLDILRASGWPNVQRAFEAIDVVDALGIDPADAAPDHWRHVHNRPAAGETPRSYTLRCRDAWLSRKGTWQ